LLTTLNIFEQVLMKLVKLLRRIFHKNCKKDSKKDP
jgi:hypothetical protein